MKIVIVGAGEVGFHIAGRLALEKKDVVLIDTNAEAIRRASEHSDVQTVIGSGSSPAVLEEAGLPGADFLLAVTDSDETNLVACLVANIISPTTKKMARVRSADFDQYDRRFKDNPPHIDALINPEIEVVKTIERLMTAPGAVEVGEFADKRLKFIGVRLDEGSRFAGIKLSEITEVSGERIPLIAAIVRGEELIVPDGSRRLRENDLVYFMTEEEKLLETLRLFDKHSQPIRRAMIIGGGRLGLRLARLLENGSIYTKIIEKRPGRCAELADQLNKAVVLHGDGSDKELLMEENIQEIDMVISLTDDEETNILASLLAKQMGARKSITTVNKFSYFPLMTTIGLELVVSPRLSAINTILRHFRRGKVLSAIAIKGEQAEFMEAVALETAGIVGKPLQNVPIPKGVLLTGLIRKEELIFPTGQTVVEVEDRMIIFALRQAIPKMEKLLTVKLEYF
ncbi:MAG: Trk system potassium transporter TrkA [Desulfobacterales bacterium]|nr:Trk system potassium transporter TrkA [Desulfobacterales bacterium]